MHFLLATRNADKIREAREIFAERGLSLSGLPEVSTDIPDPEETGATFAENAALKARYFADALRRCGLLPADTAVLSDDSGLVIDALDGQPGVYSARFMGEGTAYSVKNAYIIGLLAEVPDGRRSARFECAVAAVMPDGPALVTAEGTVEGQIAYEPRGENGFGYDPIFYLPERGLTTAELPRDEKNAISHRGRALRALLEKLSA